MINLIKQLFKTAPLVHQIPTLGGRLKRIKYCARGLLFAGCTKEWFALLQSPGMAFIIRKHPYLFHKLQRPYLNCNLNTHHRLALLKQHYQFVTTHLSSSIVQSIYTDPGLRLAAVVLKELGNFELRLNCSRNEKEGDLTIALRNVETGIQLFTVSFSITNSEAGCTEICIGGLQGHKSADKQLIIAMTRGLFGLRPKALLIYVLQQLVAGWKISRLRAVSDARHIYNHFQKRKKLAASYDEFWVECGGIMSADGFFDLPVRFISREIADLKVNKRQMYRRRYAMLAALTDQMNLSHAETKVSKATPQQRSLAKASMSLDFC